MASHVIGPLLIADRPLTAGERATLDTESVWNLGLLESTPPPPTAVAWQPNRLTAAMTASQPAATWSEQ